MIDLPVISIISDGVEISYDSTVAFRASSFCISGNVIAIIGHNGAGKSTLIKSLLGILKPTTGNLSIGFAGGSEKRPLIPHRDMAFCPETGSVFADISVERYIELWCRIRCSSARHYRKGGAHYIELLDIQPLLKKKGRELSKGQRRRVQTALGFMIEPLLFLFDEPFDGLDVGRTNQLMEIVEEERGKRCFIISSHRMDVVERVADTILVLKQGTIQTSGSVLNVCATLLGDRRSATLTDAMRHHLSGIANF